MDGRGVIRRAWIGVTLFALFFVFAMLMMADADAPQSAAPLDAAPRIEGHR